MYKLYFLNKRAADTLANLVIADLILAKKNCRLTCVSSNLLDCIIFVKKRAAETLANFLIADRREY